MKQIIFFMLFPAILFSQKGETLVQPTGKFYEQYPAYIPSAEGKKPFKLDLSTYKFTVPFAFGSGLMDGWNQTLNFHYPEFKRVFPGAKDQFWNPAISWENKYAKDKSGAVLTDYEAFPFSTTALVLVTDGHHLTRAGDHLFLYAGIALNIGERKRWTHYVADVVFHSLARSIGFNAVYHIAF